MEKGELLYNGLPCIRCYQERRYVRSNKCVKCGESKVLAEKAVLEDKNQMDQRKPMGDTLHCLNQACSSIKRYYTRKDGSKWCSRCRAPLVEGLPPRKEFE